MKQTEKQNKQILRQTYISVDMSKNIFDTSKEINTLAQIALSDEFADDIHATLEKTIHYTKLKGKSFSSYSGGNREAIAVKVEWYDREEKVNRVTRFPSIQILRNQCTQTLKELQKRTSIAELSFPFIEIGDDGITF